MYLVGRKFHLDRRFAVEVDGYDVNAGICKEVSIETDACFDVISINVNGRNVYEYEIFTRQDTPQFFLGESKDHKSV